MKFEKGTKGNQNRATYLPSFPQSGATVATSNVTTICTPKRGAMKDIGYTTPIGVAWGLKRLGRAQKGNKERMIFDEVRSKLSIILLSKRRSTPTQPYKPPLTAIQSFIDSVQ